MFNIPIHPICLDPPQLTSVPCTLVGIRKEISWVLQSRCQRQSGSALASVLVLASRRRSELGFTIPTPTPTPIWVGVSIGIGVGIRQEISWVLQSRRRCRFLRELPLASEIPQNCPCIHAWQQYKQLNLDIF